MGPTFPLPQGFVITLDLSGPRSVCPICRQVYLEVELIDNGMGWLNQIGGSPIWCQVRRRRYRVSCPNCRFTI
jgi:hypothetical protein